MKVLTFTLSFFIFVISNSQNTTDYGSLYPNEDVVITNLSRHISITDKKGKLAIVENVNETDLFLTDNQLTSAKKHVSYNTFNTIKHIKAFTENELDDTDSDNEVDKFTDKDILMNGVFFNDQKEKSFVFPNVKKGSKTHLIYQKQIKDPHFLPAFIISKSNPIHKGVFSISYPNNVQIGYKTFHLDTLNTNFKKTEADGKTTLTWTFNAVPKINRYYDLSPLYYIPQIIPYIKSYTNKGISTNILSTPKDLYTWYGTLIANTNEDGYNNLKALTLKLVDSLTTQEDKIKRIYYFVQNEINYIAFEDGLNGFIPRNAMNVYLNKYGDCKDMANILNQMLNYAGIPSYLTWIGTRRKPYSYFDVPTPFTDNHMITAVKHKDEYLFLDATAKYLGYGLPSPFIQGKEALIGLDKTNFKIVKVPEMDAKKSVQEVNSTIRIDSTNLSLNGTHNINLTGYEKLEFLHKFNRKKEKDLGFLLLALKYGTKKTKFNQIAYKHTNREQLAVNISFNTSTKSRIRKIDDELYVKPNLDHSLESEIIKNEAKKFDKNIDYKFEKHFTTKLLIPNHYRVKDLPKPINFENDLFNFKITYHYLEEKQELIIEKKISVNTLRVQPSQTEQWNNFITALIKVNKHNIVLKTNTK